MEWREVWDSFEAQGTKKPLAGLFLENGSTDWDRTSDLGLMSPTL